MSKNIVLAVGAHGDDLEWGCGGSLIKHVGCGDEVYGLHMTGCNKESDKNRREEALKAGEILGLKDVLFAELPDGRLTDSPLDAKYLRQQIGKLGVTVLYKPSENDDHSDHVACSRLVNISSDSISKVLIYPGPRNTIFPRPNYYVEINMEQLEKKIESYKTYGSQLNKGSLFVDMIEGMAITNGCLMAHGKSDAEKRRYAEGFLVYKI